MALTPYAVEDLCNTHPVFPSICYMRRSKETLPGNLPLSADNLSVDKKVSLLKAQGGQQGGIKRVGVSRETKTFFAWHGVHRGVQPLGERSEYGYGVLWPLTPVPHR